MWSVFQIGSHLFLLPSLSGRGLRHLSSRLLQLVTEMPFPLSLAPAYLFKCTSSSAADSTASIHPECFQFPEYNLSFQVCMVCRFFQYFYSANTCLISRPGSVSSLWRLPSHRKHGWPVPSLCFISICVFKCLSAYLSKSTWFPWW